ncbi:MAG: hypothetical protein ACYDB6_09605 [Candidatus Limnocylindrales bacterium]
MRARAPILSLVLVALIGAACNAPTAAGLRPSASPTHQTAVPPSGSAPLATSGPSPASASVAPERLLFLRRAPGTSADAIVAVSSSSGRIVARLPLGVPDAGWSVLYAAATVGERTTVAAYEPRSGSVLRQRSLAGSFALPVVVPGGLPGGLTSDGRTLVLVDRAPGTGSSRFAFLDAALVSPPRFVTLPGGFAFDALSPDGRFLYLIEHLGQPGSGHYQVRAYDSAAGALLAGAIVDKRNVGEAMEGRPVARVSSADGRWVYTLYVRTDGTAFVHELDTTDTVALCADLPTTARATSAAEVMAWRLALRGTDLPYAANGRLGILVALDAGGVRATGRIVTASATDSDGLAVAADGQALYVGGPDGVTTYATGALLAVGQMLRTPPLAGIAASADGHALYGAAADGTGIVELAITASGGASAATVRVVDIATGDRPSFRLLAVADRGA